MPPGTPVAVDVGVATGLGSEEEAGFLVDVAARLRMAALDGW